MDTATKLSILAAAARYDASCSTSGSARATAPGGMGNGAVGGICHSFAADGRCIALLKVLLSNACAWDCAYCANRRSAEGPRASFEPEELVRLVMDFYKRNYIEGILLSSGVVGCPDTTMERLLSVARTLRTRERWNGYIHLKAIPGASERLVAEAARWADRVSVNIEMPSAASLARVAPDKSPASIFGPMRVLARAGGFEPRRLVAASAKIDAAPPPAAIGEESSERGLTVPAPPWPGLPASPVEVAEPRPLYDQAPVPSIRRYGSEGGLEGPSVGEARRSRRRDPDSAVLPAGQTTQLVVGASPENDASILVLAENLYLAYDVRRVYYSAFVPVAPDPRLPALARPPLLREHRLYQADWLFRFYGFTATEVFAGGAPDLEEDLDPKCAWALRNLGSFPLSVERASYAELLRVPGIGPVSASRILKARRSGTLDLDRLRDLGVVTRRAAWFLDLPGRGLGPAARLRAFDDPSFLRGLLADPGPRARIEALARAERGGTQLELGFGEA